MGFKRGENPHHPAKGSSIRVDPIRDVRAIARIKKHLYKDGKYRDLCLFTLGINTAWRANELLSITVGQVRSLKPGDSIELKQSKTGKYRRTPINDNALRAIQSWLEFYEGKFPNRYSIKAPLFPSIRGGALRVSSVTSLVKNWCDLASLKGQYGSHTLRKTWAYHQRVSFHAPLPLIMEALGHTSERQTLAYIGILPVEVDELYLNVI